MKSLFKVLLLISCAFFLISCSEISTQPPTNLQQGTIDSEPPYKAIERNSEPVSDGILSLTIEKREARCHHVDDPISINLIFKNLTDQT